MLENVVTCALGIDVQGLGCPRAGACAARCWHTPLLVRLHSSLSGFVTASAMCPGGLFHPTFLGALPDHSSAWYKLGNVKALGHS